MRQFRQTVRSLFLEGYTGLRRHGIKALGLQVIGEKRDCLGKVGIYNS